MSDIKIETRLKEAEGLLRESLDMISRLPRKSGEHRRMWQLDKRINAYLGGGVMKKNSFRIEAGEGDE